MSHLPGLNTDTLTQQTYDAISGSAGAKKSRWGWERFDRRFRPRVLWRSRRKGLCYADAEDCAATVMLKMLDHAPNFYDSKGRSRATHSFQAFLNKVTDHLAFDYLQANERFPQLESETPIDRDISTRQGQTSGATPGDLPDGPTFDVSSFHSSEEALDEYFEESLLLALKELMRRRQSETVRAFLLRAMTDMTWAEIAAETGMKPNTAMKAHERCCAYLRSLLSVDE